MITFNTNGASLAAAYHLNHTNLHLQRSLERLSSGSRINSSQDDAGGLAVSMKLSASIRRTEATQANLNNALSFLQTQDGVLKSADKVLTRMSELSALAQDVTKSESDISLYNTELDSLKGQLSSLFLEEFNGVSLFANATDAQASLSVVTSQDGAQEVQISKAELTEDPFVNMMENGFRVFTLNGRTLVAKTDAIDMAELTSFDNTTGMTVYDIETGQELIMNTFGAANSTGTSFTPNPSSSTGIYEESHSVHAFVYTTSGSLQISASFAVNYSNNTGDTSSHVMVATSLDDLLGDGANESSAKHLDLSSENALNHLKISKLAIQSMASMRATNGSEQVRLTFAGDMLSINRNNLESARSRITDVDIAGESANMARLNILQRAGTAMLSQANMSSQSILRLIM
jgi:flagellin